MILLFTQLYPNMKNTMQWFFLFDESNYYYLDRCDNDKAFSFISYIIILVIVGELDEVGSK